jgi:hypothetical protein
MLNENLNPITPDQESELTPETSKFQRDTDKGVPKVFHPQDWDIEEEIQKNEAFRE